MNDAMSSGLQPHPLGDRPYPLMDAYELLGRRLRLLLAEDDADVRWSLTALFLNAGYEVQAVKDGAQLMDELASVIVSKHGKQAPDVIVTDVMMPGMNSLNVMTGLRDAGWTTPLIVISGFGDSSMRQRVQSLGGAEFFAKPLDLDALETAVAAAANRRRFRIKRGTQRTDD